MALQLKRMSTAVQCSEVFWRKDSAFERMVEKMNERLANSRFQARDSVA
jgi:hypothetical protein